MSAFIKMYKVKYKPEVEKIAGKNEDIWFGFLTFAPMWGEVITNMDYGGHAPVNVHEILEELFLPEQTVVDLIIHMKGKYTGKPESDMQKHLDKAPRFDAHGKKIET